MTLARVILNAVQDPRDSSETLRMTLPCHPERSEGSPGFFGRTLRMTLACVILNPGQDPQDSSGGPSE